ncbi:MAG: hypothetical protein CMO55_22555 [Verrucomicrobiales bacterium]|nr:hypothetical protein [Verrucomicrobiales bacterium]
MYLKQILFLAVTIASVSCWAQDAYLVEALRSNPEVEAAYQNYEAAMRKAPQVRALDEPVASYSEFLSSVQTRTGPQERVFSISQALPWPGVLKLKEKVADANARVAYFQYETKRREVIEKVGLATIEYAYLKEATDRASENLGLIRQLGPVVDEKVRTGGSLSNRLRLDVELAMAEQEFSTLTDQRPGLDAQLKANLGREPDSETIPWPHLPSRAPALMPLDRIKGEIQSHHPRIHLADAFVEKAERGEALADKSNKPSFTLGANAIDIGNGGETASSVMVGVKLPLRREKYRAEREEAEAMTRSAGASREAIRQMLIAEAIRYYAAQQESIDRLRNYDNKLIPSAEQAVELTKEDFRNDKASLTDLIESERVLLDLRLMRARALADAHKAAWQIRVLTEPYSSEK